MQFDMPRFDRERGLANLQEAYRNACDKYGRVSELAHLILDDMTSVAYRYGIGVFALRALTFTEAAHEIEKYGENASIIE